jgi:hypothetical protein
LFRFVIAERSAANAQSCVQCCSFYVHKWNARDL